MTHAQVKFTFLIVSSVFPKMLVFLDLVMYSQGTCLTFARTHPSLASLPPISTYIPSHQDLETGTYEETLLGDHQGEGFILRCESETGSGALVSVRWQRGLF